MTPTGVREMVLFRIVETDPPTRHDFTSAEGLGKPPRGNDPLAQRVWSGISVYQTENQARHKARTYPGLGRYIAMLKIPDSADVKVERTFPGSAGHHTLWGDAEETLRYVAGVVPV